MPPKRRREKTPDGRAVQPRVATNNAATGAGTAGSVSITDAAGGARVAQSSNLNFAVTLNNDSNQIILDKLAELANAIAALQRSQKTDAESHRTEVGSLREQVESIGKQVEEQGQAIKSIRRAQTKQGPVLKHLLCTSVSQRHIGMVPSIQSTPIHSTITSPYRA
ncbi:uncharacterized protein LOC62_03G004351 [Vanrija pseudolonga]|uniref:Uncharacterized protein n=1 Tax=Vanrija pseudolonga TaxID=143232 RepID=A0AAF0Y5U0_9TREE|nr:hypothetical protein LOC62_03G004351 [Vanrija pseudolonga]